MAAVKFRGFDPSTGMARWGLAAVAIGIVVGATAPTAARGLATVVDANPQSLVWLFERMFAWLFNFRRLVVRYEYHVENFKGFLQLAAAVILLRHL